MNVVPIRFHNTSMNRELGTLQNGSSGFWGHLWSGNSVAKALKTASILWQTLSSHTSANNHITVIPKPKTSWKWKKCIPKDIPKNCQNSVSFTSLHTPCIPGNMTFYIPMTQRDNLSCTKIHFNFLCWTVSIRFQKNVRAPDWPPLMIGKQLSAWWSEYDSNTSKI